MQKKELKLAKLREVFSPSSPIKKRDLFYGRLKQIEKVVDTIGERGKHAILYGERGVGKTSLANILVEIFPSVICTKVTCNRTEKFDSIWRKALKQIKFVNVSNGVGFNAAQNKEIQQLDFFIPTTEEIDSTNLEHILKNLNNYLLFIFDEFDSISDQQTKIKMADTIKAMSDNVQNVSIMIVGIANSVKDLIGEHPSLERCLTQIKMPTMSDEEVTEIVKNGLEKLELSYSEIFLNKIIQYSSGFPHYTHLLSKYSAENCIIEDRSEVSKNDFNKAVSLSIANANESLRLSYQKGIFSSYSKTQLENVIAACASVKVDEYNCFTVTDVLQKFNANSLKDSTRQSITYSLNTLCQKERGEIFEKIKMSRNIKYKFKNPLMLAFVRLKLYVKEELKLFSSN
jgi:Cdc6-like AAA superfamily ATPase